MLYSDDAFLDATVLGMLSLVVSSLRKPAAP